MTGMSLFVVLAVLCNIVVVVEDIGGIVVEVSSGFSVFVVVTTAGVDVDSGGNEVVDN